MHVPDRLRALRDRDFRLLLGAHAISFVGDGMVTVGLAFAVIEIGGSASDLGLVLACRALPQVLLVVPGGVVADRVSRRSAMVVADLVRLGSQGATACLLLSGGAEVGWLALLACVGGAATAFYKPASTGLMPMVAPESSLQQANALSNSARAAAICTGPPVAGVMVVAVGAGWVLAVDALTFAASALLLSRIDVPAQAARRARSIAADLREGWQIFSSRTWLWALTLRDAVDNLLFACWNVLGPFAVASYLGGAAAWGLVAGAFGGGLIAGGALALRIEPRRPLLVVAVPAQLAAVPLAALALQAPTAVLAVAAFASGTGTMVSLTVWHTTLQRHIPAAALSRVSAYDWLGSLAAQPIGLALWAPVAAAIGLAGALWAACALALASSLATLALPSVRALPASPEREPLPAR